MNLNTLIDIIAIEAKKPFDYPTQVIVKNLIITARAALIRRQFEQTKTFPTNAIIELCADLESVNSTECCGVDLGCLVVRTIKQIPVPIDVKDEIIFEYAGSITGTDAFGYIKPNEVQFIRYRKFSAKLPFYSWINRKVVVFNLPVLEKIKLRYVPSNPVDAADFSSCSGKPCFNIEDTAFIEDHWEDAITKMVLPKLGTIENEQIPVDEQK